jgi:tetratricopeptide (TPR) repeat protein
MTDTFASPPTLLRHAVFLTRGGDAASSAPAVRIGQGAFLALRLVDLLRSEPATEADVFHYQWSATERYCRELEIVSPETSHLLAVVQSARDAFSDNRVSLVTPALFAYAHFLEEESRYEEALDVLATLELVGDRTPPGAEAIATMLRIARVNRKMARFEEAETAYELAGRCAQEAGDRYSTLLSRIGRANIVLDRGNVSDAERAYVAIAAEARDAGVTDAEARAEHGIGSARATRGQTAAAIPHVWHAYELYEDAGNKCRALTEVGILLKAMGDLTGAERALQQAIQKCAALDHTTSAIVELIEVAFLRGDQVGFERWREEGRVREDRMRPATQADFYLKQGLGDAKFGRARRGRAQVERALEIARLAGLHEVVFRVEGILNGLGDPEAVSIPTPPEAAEPVFDTALESVRASLRAMAEA